MASEDLTQRIAEAIKAAPDCPQGRHHPLHPTDWANCPACLTLAAEAVTRVVAAHLSDDWRVVQEARWILDQAMRETE